MTIANKRGLTARQVFESRKKHGANILTPPPKTSLWKKFLEKFTDPLIIILLVALLLSIGIACYEYWCLGKGAAVFFEPVGIFCAIILATGLGFIFEVKAEKEFAILNRVNDDTLVTVLRDGNITRIPKKEVVVGDIVILTTGDEVPADGNLLSAVSLTMDESSLTGEPLCHKTTESNHFDPEATYPANRVLRGTKVMEGHGEFEVDCVGDATENGKVMVDAQIDNSVKTPLDEQLGRLGNLIAKASYIIGILIIFGRCLMYYFEPGFQGFYSIDFGAYLLQSLMIAVTLVVVSVPEGLPMAVTLSLAYSMRRMLRTNNLVRKMHACETMGATTVICTDKTGTLTRNQMQVAATEFYGDTPQDLIDEGIAVNTTASIDNSGGEPRVIGNPTEGALLLKMLERGVNFEQIRSGVNVLGEIPFSTERKYMATIVEGGVTGQKPIIYVKGAPEIVLAQCADVAGAMSREEIANQLLDYQQHAMRTLGFAYQVLDDGEVPDLSEPTDLSGFNRLKFIGIAAISDPVRDEVPASIKECLDAGIAIKIVTGDTPATATEIGREVGLISDADTKDAIITGPEFAALSDDELIGCINSMKIIARARPGDKRRLVETLQKVGQIVAVTGDGTNDAPALKAAHVGLSMGDGTSVAKEASDITIIDNSFKSIGRAVMWGRSLYKNIQRFILFQLTVNVAACLIVLAGAFMGTESPLSVTQMLWVNLIMDTFAAMALASLPPDPSVMHDKPRDRHRFIISSAMWKSIMLVGIIFVVILLAILWVFEHKDITSLSQLAGPDVPGHGLTPYEISLFFTIFVFMQFWNLFNAKAFSTKRSAFHLSHCGWFDFIALTIIIGQIVIVEFGGPFFQVEPLKFTDWLWIIGSTSLVLWIGEIIRLLQPAKH